MNGGLITRTTQRATCHVRRTEMDESDKNRTQFYHLLDIDIIIENILRFLGIGQIRQLSRVCQKFHIICDRYLGFCRKFDFVNLRQNYPKLSRLDVTFLLSKARHVVELNLNSSQNLICEKTLATFFTRAEHLRKLDLSNCHLEQYGNFLLFIIANYCPKIQELLLDGCSWLSSEALAEIGNKCLNIRTLSIRGCDGIDDTPLEILFRNNQHLTELNVRYCRQISEKSICLLNRCSKIKRLDVSRCCAMPDSVICHISNGFEHLLELNLTHIRLSAGAIRQIGLTVSTLEKIMLAGISTVNDDNFSIIAENNKNLIHVDLSYCRHIVGRCLTRLSKYCKRLRVLHLAGCIGIEDTAIMSIGDGCKDLREINFEECDWLSVNALIEIARTNHNLRLINLANCECIGDAGLVRIFEQNRFLESLNIANCSKVTGFSLQQMTVFCDNLSCLNISKCMSIKDTDFRHCLERLANLEYIDLQECSWISAKTIATMGRKCHRLKGVILSQCSAVNCRSLFTLLINNARLKYVDLAECNRVTGPVLLTLRKMYPDVSFCGLDTTEYLDDEEENEKNHYNRKHKWLSTVKQFFITDPS